MAHINNLTIEFCRVPGHSGILGIELVDTLTKSAYDVEFSNNNIPHSDFVILLRVNLINVGLCTSLVSFCLDKGKWLAENVAILSTKA